MSSEIKLKTYPKCWRPKPCIVNHPCENSNRNEWYEWCLKCDDNGQHAETYDKAVMLWNEEGGAE